tara:strand:+ start:903 stop:1160 length:258 start_codon:yes stop_codon:yes gene_type:complete
MIRTEEFLLLLLLLLLIFLILFLDFIDQDYSRPRYSTQSPLPCVCVTGRLFRAATSKDQFRSFSLPLMILGRILGTAPKNIFLFL